MGHDFHGKLNFVVVSRSNLYPVFLLGLELSNMYGLNLLLSLRFNLLLPLYMLHVTSDETHIHTLVLVQKKPPMIFPVNSRQLYSCLSVEKIFYEFHIPLFHTINL